MMKIVDLIQYLDSIERKYGNVDVLTWGKEDLGPAMARLLVMEEDPATIAVEIY